jgi:hypothetical protein
MIIARLEDNENHAFAIKKRKLKNGNLFLSIGIWDDEYNTWIPYCPMTIDFEVLNEGFIYFSRYVPETIIKELEKQGWIRCLGHEVVYHGYSYSLFDIRELLNHPEVFYELGACP